MILCNLIIITKNWEILSQFWENLAYFWMSTNISRIGPNDNNILHVEPEC